MSTSIQNALDLPVLEDLLRANNEEGEDNALEAVEDDDELSTMTENLGRGMVTQEVLDAAQERDHENAADKIHKEALQHSKDLMDLGYNVDTRSAGKMFENAATMLKIALDAKNSKRDAQLKARKLGQEDRKLDIMERQSKGGQTGDVVEGNSVVVVEDRNEIIKQLRSGK